MQQPIPNDPISAFPPRNLFSNPSQPRGSDEQQQPDPFDDDLDLSGELGVFEQLDAIKFLLQHFDIEQADPVLFERLKRRTFTVPHAVEQLIKEDAYFSSQLARFYAALASQSGLDLRSSVINFRKDAAMSQTSSESLAEVIVIYCIYRTANAIASPVPRHLVTQLQEIVEITFRTARCGLLSLLQQCRDGLARYQNSYFLSGLTLVDSPGQMFLMDGGIRSKFLSIMGICAQLYLTSNSALLCDISLLIDRLMVGSNAGHELKQVVTNSSNCPLERIEIWLARRKPHNDDLIAACDMLGQRQEIPGDSTMITDTINNALHPVFSDFLRTVMRSNGVPRNALTWKDFESLLADTQLQLDADPESVVSQLSLCQSPAILALEDLRPPGKTYPAGHQQIAGLNPTPQPSESDLLNLKFLTVFPNGQFPASIADCKDCYITCKDCSVAFEFFAAQQSFYLEKIKFPNFPKSCDKCRKVNKLRKEAAGAPAAVLIAADNSQPPVFPDPVSAPATQPFPAAIPAAVDHSHSAWDEDFHF